MKPTRPALDRVLHALTGSCGPRMSAQPWSHHDNVSLVLPEGPVASSTFNDVVVPFGGAKWITTDPAEAVERLRADPGDPLWPWDVGERGGASWWCAQCDGGGGEFSGCDHCGYLACGGCGGFDGVTARPPSLAALVAVASFGTAPVLRAAALADVIDPGSRVAWRPMAPDTLRRWHEDAAALSLGDYSLRKIFSCETRRAATPGRYGGEPAWPERCPWASHLTDVHGAWPALREMHLLGVHLLGCGEGHVMLGVESLC